MGGNLPLVIFFYTQKARCENSSALLYRLSFADEFLPAFWAGDGDLTLAPGDPDGLMAAGAAIIPMLPVLLLLQEHKIPAVFLITLIGVPG